MLRTIESRQALVSLLALGEVQRDVPRLALLAIQPRHARHSFWSPDAHRPAEALRTRCARSPRPAVIAMLALGAVSAWQAGKAVNATFALEAECRGTWVTDEALEAWLALKAVEPWRAPRSASSLESGIACKETA